MRLWRVGIVGGIVGFALSGCEPPSEIVPVTPPGANIPRTISEEEKAEALGETAPQAPSAEAATGGATGSVLAPPTDIGQTKTTKGGVTYETIKQGTGPELKSGQAATLHYVGTVENGEVFESTRTTNKPAKFRIGIDPLIPGWQEGVPGMKVGEVRKLIIPPAMGYGERGKPPTIPPNSTLIFEVELVDVVP